MNKRILALILIGAMALSMLSGCKAGDEDINLDYSGGEQQLPFDEDDIASEDSKGDQENQTSGKPNNSAGDKTPNQNDGSDQNDAPADADDSADKKPADQNKPSNNQGASSEGLKEPFGGGKPISVSAGETIWYGPASTAQKEQLIFTDSAGKTTKVEIEQLQKVDTFNNGYVIYAYKASAAGSISLKIPETYKDLFLASKDEMDLNAYYTHWDNISNRNLYVASLDKSSKQIDTDGKLQSSEDSAATHAIPVKQGDKLTFAPVSSATMVLGCGYDDKMKPIDIISGYGLKEAFVFTYGMRAYTYTVPAGVSFVRFNVPEEVRDHFVVMKNKEFDLKYYTGLTKVSADEIDDPLSGKKCVFVGDSLCSASQDAKVGDLRGWARRVKELSGAICTNLGRGGAALSNCRLDEESTEFHIIYKQFFRTTEKDFDYVLIEGGTNDAWESAPVGKVTQGYDPTFFDLNTYAGGLEMAIYTAITEYGKTAAIGYLMTYQMPRNKHGLVATGMNNYYDVGKKICEKWNVSYFDMYNNTEINQKLNPAGSEHVPDGTHADESGYDILGPYITDYMKSMTPVTQKIRNELAAIG